MMTLFPHVYAINISRIHLTKKPRLGGIKVYNRNVERGEIVMDAEVCYSGDARVLLTLQVGNWHGAIGGEINCAILAESPLTTPYIFLVFYCIVVMSVFGLSTRILNNIPKNPFFFSQGMQCEVRGVQFRGMARITLKPVLPSFPFVGGFELTWV